MRDLGWLSQPRRAEKGLQKVTLMGFASGTVSFRRFVVLGDSSNKLPTAADQKLLDALAEHALKPGEFGVPEEVEYGWGGGRHVLDANFSFEHNVFADALHFALRIDTNKVPADLKKAYQIMEEEAVAATNPSGFISKNQKKDVKDTIRKKVEEDMRSGKFRRSKLLPVLWDLPSLVVSCAASGGSYEKLAEIFERTFNLQLLPISSGSLGLRLLEPRGRRRDYEDLKPTRFAYGPGGENEYPDYPWVAQRFPRQRVPTLALARSRPPLGHHRHRGRRRRRRHRLHRPIPRPRMRLRPDRQGRPQGRRPQPDARSTRRPAHR
jgi:hypothetical protein